MGFRNIYQNICDAILNFSRGLSHLLKRKNMSTPPKKSMGSFSGAATYQTAFNKEWCKKYPIIDVPNFPENFRCDICSCVSGYKHQGEAGIRRHVERPQNLKKVNDFNKMNSLSNYGFRKCFGPVREQVIIL